MARRLTDLFQVALERCRHGWIDLPKSLHDGVTNLRVVATCPEDAVTFILHYPAQRWHCFLSVRANSPQGKSDVDDILIRVRAIVRQLPLVQINLPVEYLL